MKLFFRKRTKDLSVIVFMDKVGKYQHLVRNLQEGTWIAYYFNETRDELGQLLQAASRQFSMGDDASFDNSNQIVLINAHWLIGMSTKMPKNLVLAELHPLYTYYKQLQESIDQQTTQITVYTSLDARFLQEQGQTRIIRVMQRMGVKQDEALNHPMITKSIMKMLQKIEKQVPDEKPADSEHTWFELNF